MTRRYISSLQPGEQIDDEVFLIQSKDLRTTTQGSLYIHAVIADRTGQMPARVWQATEAMYNGIPDGGFLRLKGRTEAYKGTLQFIVDAIRVADPETIDLADFLPRTERDIDQLFARFREIMAEIANPHLAALVKEFLADEELMGRFRQAPAALTMHHAYLGGLLEHTVNLLEAAIRVIPLYPELSLDLVLVGLLLHDIGKTSELAYTTSLAYTDEGQLLGHITQAVIMVEKKVDAMVARTGKAFPDHLRWAVQHLILSHHGAYEFGSPKLPAFPEAVAIHYLDNLDAKINLYLHQIETDRDDASHWTGYHRGVETKIFKLDVAGARSGLGRSPG